MENLGPPRSEITAGSVVGITRAAGGFRKENILEVQDMLPSRKFRKELFELSWGFFNRNDMKITKFIYEL